MEFNPQLDHSKNKKRMIKMMKALGNPIRFQIIEFLAECQACITNDIVKNTTLAQSTISQHLKVLREAGFVKGELEGPATCYCLDIENLVWFKENLSEWLTEIKSCCPTE